MPDDQILSDSYIVIHPHLYQPNTEIEKWEILLYYHSIENLLVHGQHMSVFKI